jgi:hypothetical protein
MLQIKLQPFDYSKDCADTVLVRRAVCGKYQRSLTVPRRQAIRIAIMWVFPALLLFIWRLLWRIAGFPGGARALVDALGSENPNIQAIARIFLLKAGADSAPYLEESLRRRENLPMVLSLLGDVGDRHVEPELQRFALDRDPRIASAARHALRVLELQR